MDNLFFPKAYFKKEKFMRKKIFGVIVVVAMIIGFLPQSAIAFSSNGVNNTNAVSWQNKTPEQIVSEMTPEQQILQTFFMYFRT